MRKSIKLFAGILIIAMLISGIISMTVMAASTDGGTDADTSASSKEEKFNKEKRSSGKNKGVHVDVLSVAASVLEMDKSELKEAVRNGKVGDLLIAAGKVEEFKAAYLSELKAKADAAVADGTMTQEQADEKYESGKEKMENYDGTTHLCGHDDHSKMFEKKEKPSDKSA